MTTFSWKKCRERALQKALYRSTRLLLNNPDWQLKHPQEYKEYDKNLCGKAMKCHQNIEKLIKTKAEQYARLTDTPTVIRPTRLSHG